LVAPCFLGGLRAGRFARRLLRGRLGLFRDLPHVDFDDFAAACDGLLHTLTHIRAGLRRERQPLRFELPQRSRVQRVVDAAAMPFERGAQGLEVAVNLREPRFLGMQRIAFLLDDSIDILVATAQLFQEPPQFGGVLDASVTSRARRCKSSPASLRSASPSGGCRMLSGAGESCVPGRTSTLGGGVGEDCRNRDSGFIN
jgi:hypothetical protein